ncbi:MAG: YlxR family protein [Chloroflexia bacterium]
MAARQSGPKVRRQPQRTCVACRQVEGKRGLRRLVKTPEGAVELDPTGKRSGRGAFTPLPGVHSEGVRNRRGRSGAEDGARPNQYTTATGTTYRTGAGRVVRRSQHRRAQEVHIMTQDRNNPPRTRDSSSPAGGGGRGRGGPARRGPNRGSGGRSGGGGRGRSFDNRGPARGQPGARTSTVTVRTRRIIELPPTMSVKDLSDCLASARARLSAR